MIIRVAHLYPDYLNIYADRGNIAVFRRRAELRGHDLVVTAIGLGDSLRAGEHDLLYIGGGQDREQTMVAPDMAARADVLRESIEAGAALLGVCGGYQLLGRGYRGRDGEWMPGASVLPLETVAGDTRMIGNVLLDCELEPGKPFAVAGFENHAGRTLLDPGARPFGRVVAGYGNDGSSNAEGCIVAHAIGTYLHGPLLPRNPELADTLLSWAIGHRSATAPEPLAPLNDELERAAHLVAAGRARSRRR